MNSKPALYLLFCLVLQNCWGCSTIQFITEDHRGFLAFTIQRVTYVQVGVCVLCMCTKAHLWGWHVLWLSVCVLKPTCKVDMFFDSVHSYACHAHTYKQASIYRENYDADLVFLSFDRNCSDSLVHTSVMVYLSVESLDLLESLILIISKPHADRCVLVCLKTQSTTSLYGFR